jgi:hypothetical protein
MSGNQLLDLKNYKQADELPNMKFLSFFLILTVFVTRGFCGDQSKSQKDTNGIVFREPFTLTLHVDKEHYYEQKIPKIPYVHENDVYLFKGDSFGIDLNITNDVIQSVVYQPDTNKAAVTFRFSQIVETDGKSMMILETKNNTKQKLFFDALMTVPDRQRAMKTSLLPVRPELGSYESWPHPIVQLVLRNIRLKEKSDVEQNSPVEKKEPVKPKTSQTSAANRFQ